MNAEPDFSIVVPTRDRPAQLAALLASLAQLDYPREGFETILVDDASRAPLDAVVAPWREPLAPLTLLRVPTRRGPAAARQAGIDRARGRWLAFTDDDCQPAPGWLTAAARQLRAEPEAAAAAAVGGTVVNALTDNPFAAATQNLMDYLSSRPGGPRFFTTNNVAFPAAAFRALGGLDVSWDIQGGEDRDLAHRWVRRGGRLVHAPAMVVHHAHRLTPRGFWRQHFHYGRGAFRFRRDRAREAGGSSGGLPRLERARFYLELPLYPFGRAPRPARLAALLALSQVATAAGFAREWAAETLTRRREAG